ncbi:MAG: hypothetical protein JKX84_08195 [Flavobacteriales bacterium]|nr:hypothetical protein [Flavobacteriales bacterium]
MGISKSVAQKNFSFRHFDETDGLSSDFVEAVSQSRTGHLIVASKDGLDRFDGRNFKKLRVDTTSLTHVTSLNRASGTICFGLFNGEVGKIEESGEIKQVKTGVNGQIKHIYKDEKDGVWAFSRSGMVFWLNGADTTRFNMAEQDMLINAIIPYKHKEFIIGSNDGLLLVRFESDGNFQILQKINGLPETKITALKYELGRDILWVGTEDAGLFRVFSPFSRAQSIEEFLLSKGESIDNAQVIYTDNSGRIWLGTFGNGLIRIEFYGEGKKNFVTQRFTENVDEQYLIRDIFQDAEQNIWIATFGGGLIQIVENVFHQPFNEAWLRKQSITQLFRDSKSNVWLGIDKGVFKTSEHGLQSNFQYHHIGGNEVSAITEDEQGRIWVGTKNSGLYVLKIGEKDFKQIILNKGKLANSINSIAPSKKGVYVSTKSGLFEISYSGQIIKYLSTIDGLPHNNVKFSFMDSIGRLWIANEGNRVCYLWKNEVRFIESESGQNIFGVNHILQDNRARLWFATLGQGIFILDNRTAHNVNKTKGLPSNYCYQMVLDNDENVWVSHQKSITQISSNFDIVHVVGRADITPVENSMVSFLFKDNEGNIWITSTHGVVKFNPAIDRSSKSIPQLSIAAMQVQEQDQPMLDNLELPYKKIQRAI